MWAIIEHIHCKGYLLCLFSLGVSGEEQPSILCVIPSLPTVCSDSPDSAESPRRSEELSKTDPIARQLLNLLRPAWLIRMYSVCAVGGLRMRFTKCAQVKPVDRTF